jgi:hypothetical protein
MLTKIGMAALAGTLATTVLAAPASAHEGGDCGRDRGRIERSDGDGDFGRDWNGDWRERQVREEGDRDWRWRDRFARTERERIAWQRMHHHYYGGWDAPTYYR